MIRTMLVAMLLAGTASAPALAQSADSQLKTIYDAEWQWRLGQTGQQQSGIETKPGNRLSCVTPACQAQRQAYWQDVLKRMAAIPDVDLSPEERLNRRC